MRGKPLFVAAILTAGIAAIYLLRLNSVAGLMVDDAWYVLFAKALSEGRGYRMISSAAVPMLPMYPPGFPGVLSLAFMVDPQFPDNVWLLKSVSIAAMAGVGALTYVYLHRDRSVPTDLATCAAVAVTIVPAFVFLATSTVMSECIFTLAQLLGVVLLHRSLGVAPASRARQLTICGALVAAAAVLIRTAGVALVVAALICFAKDRRWKQAALFLAVAAACLGPWLIYARSNAPTREERAAHGGAVSYDYVEQVGMRWAGSPALGRVTMADVPARIATNLVDVFGRGVGGVLVPVMFRGPAESGEEIVALGGRAGLLAGSMGGAAETMMISAALGVILMLGYADRARARLSLSEVLVVISLGITIVWPFWTFRFILPLAPFLFLYLVAGLSILARGSRRAVRVVLLCIIGLSLYDHIGNILMARGGGAVQWAVDARRVDDVIERIRNGVGQGVLATTNPALVYLRTGRTGIAVDDPTAGPAALKRRGIRYVASFVPSELPDSRGAGYTVLYRSTEGLWIIRLE